MRRERGAQAASEWRRSRERGSALLIQIMTSVSLTLGRRAARGILYGIAAYFFLFAPRARRASLDYLPRVLGRRPRARDRFRQVMSFATTVHDRLYLLNERFDLFDIAIEGEAIVRDRLHAGGGGFLIGAHLGSFEVTRAIGRRQRGLRVAMVAYEDNAQKLNATLAAINPAAKLDTVALGSVQAMLQVRELLAEGVFVGMLGDRTPGDEPVMEVEFLGAAARFPLGPMRVAALLGRPVILMLGLYLGGNRYRVVFEELADFSQLGRQEREVAVREAVLRYVGRLEEYCREYPYNWFNFYRFWARGEMT
jgi:predicted LPLAT superfamily acyltransferase